MNCIKVKTCFLRHHFDLKFVLFACLILLAQAYTSTTANAHSSDDATTSMISKEHRMALGFGNDYGKKHNKKDDEYADSDKHGKKHSKKDDKHADRDKHDKEHSKKNAKHGGRDKHGKKHGKKNAKHTDRGKHGKKHSKKHGAHGRKHHVGHEGSDPDNNAQRALILYDAPEGVPMRKLGKSYAIMLRNLLGHFAMDIEMKRIGEYAEGDVESYDALFYLGSYYSNPSPSGFLADISTTEKTVVWFKYNLWDLAWDPSYGFSEKFGINLLGTRGFNSQPTPANPEPGFFDTIIYKGLPFKKYYSYDEATQAIAADPDIGVVEISDLTKAEVLVEVVNGGTSERAPYIARSANFWYVADMPFSFIGPRDRYLVFSDILHDILNIQHTKNNRAMVRLEDVSAKVSPVAMEQLSDYLAAKQIPFSIAVIPLYKDPLGVYNGGVAEEIRLADAENLVESLRYAQPRGGDILMHGLTHQYSDVPNPWSGVTADDFEFWDIINNRPVSEDSVSWVANRIQTGLDEFSSVGITPYAWETPHYQGSPNTYAALGSVTRYERSVYYTSDDPQLNLDTNNPERDFSVGQFFPYIIASDHYGQRVLPENLGNIIYDIGQDANFVLWNDLYENARYALVVRDGFASFYFHPFWLEPEFNVPGLEDFDKLIRGITELGYQWVGGRELLNE